MFEAKRKNSAEKATMTGKKLKSLGIWEGTGTGV